MLLLLVPQTTGWFLDLSTTLPKKQFRTTLLLFRPVSGLDLFGVSAPALPGRRHFAPTRFPAGVPITMPLQFATLPKPLLCYTAHRLPATVMVGSRWCV